MGCEVFRALAGPCIGLPSASAPPIGEANPLKRASQPSHAPACCSSLYAQLVGKASSLQTKPCRASGHGRTVQHHLPPPASVSTGWRAAPVPVLPNRGLGDADEMSFSLQTLWQFALWVAGSRLLVTELKVRHGPNLPPYEGRAQMS